jgi:hypothetical protein
MALMLRCADSGAKCPFEVKADTMAMVHQV